MIWCWMAVVAIAGLWFLYTLGTIRAGVRDILRELRKLNDKIPPPAG